MITTSARLACAATLALALAACGGSYRGGGPAAGRELRGVAAAGLPFAVLDRTGHEVTPAELWDRLRAARAVCAGEQHPSPHDHWVQLQLLDQLSAPPAAAGLALGLEMVQQPFQGVLDDWAAARIDEAALRSRSAWAQRWGFDFALYRPLLELARARRVELLALNAPSELVKQVARVGVDGLAPTDRAKLPPLVLDDAQHRAWFDQVMASMSGAHGDHPHGSEPPASEPPPSEPPASEPPASGPPAPEPHHAAAAARPPPVMPSADNIYAAQVVWDESMADGAARWLAGHGGGRVLILAGNGHCHDSAIVRRLRRRGVATVISVRPIIDDGAGNVAAALAEGINDYLFVMTPPRPAP